MSPRFPFYITLKTYLVFLLCLYSADLVAAPNCRIISAKDATLVDAHPEDPLARLFQRDGSEKNSYDMLPKEGARFALEITPGLPCFLKFSLNLPSSITFSADAPPELTSMAIELTTTSTRPSQLIQKDMLAAPRDRFSAQFTLPAVDYRLKLTGKAGNDSHQPVQIIFHISQLRSKAPRITQADTRSRGAIVMLDPVSRSGFRELLIEQHSLLRLSLSNVPKMSEEEREISISLRDTDGNKIREVEGSLNTDKHKYAGYIVKPGLYYVQVDGSYNGWPSPVLTERIRSAQIGLHIDSITPYKIPPSMMALSDWLQATGLEKIIEFEELADFSRPERNLPGAYARNFGLAANVSAMHASDRRCAISVAQCKDAEKDAAAEAHRRGRPNRPQWPIGSIEADHATMVVTFRVKEDRDFIEASEAAFEKANGTSLWNRLLQKISNLENISARKIAVWIPVPCSASLMYLDDSRRARRHGAECASGSSAVPLGVEATINSAANEKIDGKGPNLAQVTRPFLTGFLNDKDATLDFLTLDADFVEVIIRGLRGRVVVGGRDWEKLQLTLSITGSAQPMLRATLDGQLASGIGRYPPDSEFTRDMDVQFKGNVTEYSKKILTALRTFLEKKP